MARSLKSLLLFSLAALACVVLAGTFTTTQAGNPSQVDTAGDTVPDFEDSDDDNDGMTDEFEQTEAGTHPGRFDSDGDTISDADERLGWVNPDGTVSGTDPTDDDTDDDGWTDGAERERGSDTNDPASTPQARP